MTKKELIKSLEPYDDYTVVIISDGMGWSNIEELKMQDDLIVIMQELYPIFSDS